MDRRAPVTLGQLDSLLSDSDADIWELAIWGNPNIELNGELYDPSSEAHQQLTDAQRNLLLVGQMDGDIGNSGIGQLFFNYGELTPFMLDALQAMGCCFAAELLGRELDRLSRVNFIPRWIEARRNFASQSGDENKRAKQWAAFTGFIDEFYSDNTVSNAYFGRRSETIECVRVYIRTHADQLFRIVEE